MAQTKRTSADLIANILQDGQSAGAITAEDIRDLLVSLAPSHGAFSINVPAATTIAVAGTYVKAAGTTSLDVDAEDFDDDSPTDNRLRYTGAPDRHVNVIATISTTSASSNQVLGFKLALNGVVIDDSVSRRKQGTGSDIGSVTLSAHVDMSTNDYIELWVTNETSTGAVTVEEIHMMATGFIS